MKFNILEQFIHPENKNEFSPQTVLKLGTYSYRHAQIPNSEADIK